MITNKGGEGEPNLLLLQHEHNRLMGFIYDDNTHTHSVINAYCTNYHIVQFNFQKTEPSDRYNSAFLHQFSSIGNLRQEKLPKNATKITWNSECRWEAQCASESLPIHQKGKLVLISIIIIIMGFNHTEKQWLRLHHCGRRNRRVPSGCDAIEEIQSVGAGKRGCAVYESECVVYGEFSHYLGRYFSNFTFPILRFHRWCPECEG